MNEGNSTLGKISRELLQYCVSLQDVRNLVLKLREFSLFLDTHPVDSVVLSLRLTAPEKAAKIIEMIKPFTENSVEISIFAELAINDLAFWIFTKDNVEIFLDALNIAANKCKHCRVSVAIELKKPELLKLKQKLQEKLHSELLLDMRINPSILGGLVIEKDARIIDASLASSLDSYLSDKALGLFTDLALNE